MDAQRIAVDAAVVPTGCDREAVIVFNLASEGFQAPGFQGPAGDGAGLPDSAPAAAAA